MNNFMPKTRQWIRLTLFHQVIQANIINNGQAEMMHHLAGHQENTASFCDIPAQGSQTKPGNLEIAGKAKLRDLLLNSWTVTFKSVKVIKVKDRLRRLKKRGS